MTDPKTPAESGRGLSPEVWAYCEYDNGCDEGHPCNHDGTLVVAVYSSKQTAEQHRDREKRGYVTRLDVRRALRDY